MARSFIILMILAICLIQRLPQRFNTLTYTKTAVKFITQEIEMHFLKGLMPF